MSKKLDFILLLCYLIGLIYGVIFWIPWFDPITHHKGVKLALVATLFIGTTLMYFRLRKAKMNAAP
jgi:cytochrome b subunit of formate dehydrogenase